MKPRVISAQWEAPGPYPVVANVTHDNRRFIEIAGTLSSYTPDNAKKFAETLTAAVEWLEGQS